MPIPLDEEAGVGDIDWEAASGMEVEEEFEVGDDLADTSSQVSGPFGFSSQLTEAIANSFQYRLRPKERVRPAHST